MNTEPWWYVEEAWDIFCDASRHDLFSEADSDDISKAHGKAYADEDMSYAQAYTFLMCVQKLLDQCESKHAVKYRTLLCEIIVSFGQGE